MFHASCVNCDVVVLDKHENSTAGIHFLMNPHSLGYLIYLKPSPSNSCVHYEPKPQQFTIDQPWIALMARVGCKFDQMDKMINEYFSFKMQIKYIPSVFVGYYDGDNLGNIMCLMPLTAASVRFCRDLHKKRKSRLSTKHLKKIPIKKFKKVMCMMYVQFVWMIMKRAKNLRVLPCAHVYHIKCIDPWLTKRKKTCPVCKRKVIPGSNPDSDSSDEDTENESTNERTPLLMSNNNQVMTTPRRSTFDNSGLPEAVRHEVTTVHVRTHRIEDSDTDSDDNSLYHTVGESPEPHSRPNTGAINITYESSSEESDEESEEEEHVERVPLGNIVMRVLMGTLL
ncbi:RNF13 [Mytilus edulis]|uniref:RNF13 n=1 Tax=Mytilus edulis TaxID=6550 RepID=A0A8S3T6V2_MYTED|nr:RNF13 [Mytilus edulis]